MMVGATLEQVVLCCMRKQAEQAMDCKLVSRFLQDLCPSLPLQVPSFRLCHEFPNVTWDLWAKQQQLTCYSTLFYHINRSQTKTDRISVSFIFCKVVFNEEKWFVRHIYTVVPSVIFTAIDFLFILTEDS